MNLYAHYRHKRKPPQHVSQHVARLPWFHRPAKGDRKPWEIRDVRFQDVVHPENLYAVFARLRGSGGSSPGLDGLRYDDLSLAEAGHLLRKLSAQLASGQYRPQAARSLRIPKTSGNGSRELKIRVILDRVVQKALDMALTPAWDRHFLPGSHGFRAGRSPLGLLADLIATMTHHNRWVLATDDVRGAFDHVEIDQVILLHKEYCHDEQLNQLIDVVLRGDNPKRCIGIDQGGAYSPTCLNVLLHHKLDLPLGADPNSPPWYRYADNLVYACQSATEAHTTLQQARKLLSHAGLSLKGQDGPPANLRGTARQLSCLAIVSLSVASPSRSAWTDRPGTPWLNTYSRPMRRQSQPAQPTRCCEAGWHPMAWPLRTARTLSP